MTLPLAAVVAGDKMAEQLTDANVRDQLRAHFEAIGLPNAAIEWLLSLWTTIQALDDVADGDPVENAESLPWTVLIGMPSNVFFRDNAQWLQPVVANMYLKWRAANRAEENGRADEQSFMWRAGYYDVVMQVVLLVHGPVKAAELSETTMRLYGETFAQYRKEFHA